MKSVVFSQFTSMLDIVCCALRRDGIPFVRVDGSMLEKKRAAAIEAFQSGVGVQGEVPEVAVMSPKAAGVGINLTAASQVRHWWRHCCTSAIHACMYICTTKDAKWSKCP